MNKNSIESSLICPECGSIFPIVRKKYNKRKNYHRKWLFCSKCNKLTNHIEVNNLDFVLEEIERIEETYRTEEEQKVYKLVRNKE